VLAQKAQSGQRKETTMQYFQRLNENTKYLREEYSKAIEGLNALWGMFELGDEECQSLKKRLDVSYQQQYDYWRKFCADR